MNEHPVSNGQSLLSAPFSAFVRHRMSDISLGLRPTTRIANSLHRCSVPEGMDPDCFKQLAEIRSKGFDLMNNSTQSMVYLWDPQIKYIMETEYSSYMRYEQALYQEGVVCILLFMGSESEDAYEHLCRKISFQMFHFLNSSGLLEE